jgi:hypothetical protein
VAIRSSYLVRSKEAKVAASIHESDALLFARRGTSDTDAAILGRAVSTPPHFGIPQATIEVMPLQAMDG